jgi:hypothetical protein
MHNLRMQEKIERGEAIDVGDFPQVDGDYVITHNFVDGVDYCVAAEDAWIWSIGRRKADGVILASTTGKFYQNPDFECIWLR